MKEDEIIRSGAEADKIIAEYMGWNIQPGGRITLLESGKMTVLSVPSRSLDALVPVWHQMGGVGFFGQTYGFGKHCFSGIKLDNNLPMVSGLTGTYRNVFEAAAIATAHAIRKLEASK